jgi:septal ring factor EnvC (AmiA/AmiB activator)
MSIAISYQLHPPAVAQAGHLPASKTQTFPVNSSSDDRTKYYGALHNAIEEAKDQLGNELTAWRDAVGKAELSKETTKTLKYEMDEEDEDEQA